MADTWDCELATTDEVWRLKHPKITVARVEAMVKALDAPALTALQLATMETKSLVLGLALVLKHVSASLACPRLTLIIPFSCPHSHECFRPCVLIFNCAHTAECLYL